jgi:GST-like protein
MIDLYSWPTPNGVKIHIMLEETDLDYTVFPVNIGKGEQFEADFLKISPNNRIPAMIDHDGPGGTDYALFESGAMLIYLAEKTGQFMATEPAARHQTIQWLMFQMGNVGPMFGQSNHFSNYAPDKIPYAIDRYTNECIRLYGVMDRRLAEAEYRAGDYSIADMATFPWARGWERRGLAIAEYPNVKRWLDANEARPGVQRGLKVMDDHRRPGGGMDAETRENLFGATQYARR